MPDKEKHTIKRLIQNLDLDKPSANFSDKVMGKVTIVSDDEILKDVKLVSLLKKNSLEIPGPDFSDRLMDKLIADTVVDYQPIISKKAWSIIAVFFASFIFYAVLSDPKTPYNNNYITEISTISNSLITSLDNSLIRHIQIPSILIVSILCLFVLLLLDTTLRTKKLF